MLQTLNGKTLYSNSYYKDINIKNLFNKPTTIANNKSYLSIPYAVKKSSIFDSYRRIILKAPLKSVDENFTFPFPLKDNVKKESIERLNRQAYELLYNKGTNRPVLTKLNKSVELKKNKKLPYRKLKHMIIKNRPPITLFKRRSKEKVVSMFKPIINTIQIANLSIVKNSRIYKSLHNSLIESLDANTFDRLPSNVIYPKKYDLRRYYKKSVKLISGTCPMIEASSSEPLSNNKEEYYPPIKSGAIIIKNKYGTIID